jgi:type I restriction enzyme M protein
MLPLTVLRRFDAVLAPTKEQVLARYETLQGKDSLLIDRILNEVAKVENGTPLGFHNRSKLDFYKLKADPDNIGQHLITYIKGFSENIQRIS